jgi:hypothetical protein
VNKADRQQQHLLLLLRQPDSAYCWVSPHAVSPPIAAALASSILADEAIELTVKVENTGNVRVQGISVTLPGATPVTPMQAQNINLASGGSAEVKFTYVLTLADLEAGSRTFTPSATGTWVPVLSSVASVPVIMTTVSNTVQMRSAPSLTFNHDVDSRVFSETGKQPHFRPKLLCVCCMALHR